MQDELAAVPPSWARRAGPRSAAPTEELEFDADAFIVEEDANVVVTRDGWIKRVRELKDPTSTRTREGDEVMAVLPGSTREKVAFFTNRGSAYVLKINDVTATTGYGDPAQKYFKFDDGEKIVCAMTLDPRANGCPRPCSRSPGAASACASPSPPTPSRPPRPGAATPGRRPATRSSGSRRAAKATPWWSRPATPRPGVQGRGDLPGSRGRAAASP